LGVGFDQLGSGREPELLLDVRAMRLDRAHAEDELLRDFGVRFDRMSSERAMYDEGRVAATLAEILLAAGGQKRDLGAQSLLRRYERARKGADLGMQAVTGGFRYLFGSHLPGLRALRDAGLRFTEQLPPIKNYFMRRASGLAGELPRLAQRVRH